MYGFEMVHPVEVRMKSVERTPYVETESGYGPTTNDGTPFTNFDDITVDCPIQERKRNL